jgi:hypothetical protein
MKRDVNEQIKQKINIFENHIVENLKNIIISMTHADLLKFITKQTANYY